MVGRGPAEAPVSPAHFKAVLLTGATGFVGRFLLRDLLTRRTNLVAHCVVRANDPEHGLARIRAAMEEAQIWDAALAPRIVAVPGDLCEPWLGMGSAGFETLCRRIDAVYHLAASLSLSASYQALRELNTASARHLFELCLTARLKPLYYASSMGVFPEYVSGFANEYADGRIGHQMQPDVADMKKFFPLGFLGYTWSKLVVEQAALYAHRIGLPVAIFRLSQVGSASTGIANADDILVRLGATIVDLRLVPRGFTWNFGTEAVDTATDIMAAISLNSERRFTIHNVADPKGLNLDIDLADFGVCCEPVSYPVFKRACLARGEASPLRRLWGLLDHLAPYWFGEGNARPGHICDRGLRLDCPDPIEWPGVYRMFRKHRDWLDDPRTEWPHAIARHHLDYDCLLRRAESYADRYGVPFDQAYPAWLRAGLKRLIRAVNSPEAGVGKSRIGDVAFGFSRLLHQNAALASARRRQPEIGKQRIERPVFIVGIGRTGTTYLHRLMARDPRFQTLRGYECLEPVTPEGDYAEVVGTVDDPRQAAVREFLEVSGTMGDFEGIHHLDVDEPEEEVAALGMGFTSWTWAVRFFGPSYARWLAANGSREAYGLHRRTLQYHAHQRRQRHPSREFQWLLKAAIHLLELDSVIQTYPDARFIQTHRSHRQFTGSFCSLVERLRSATSEPRPRHELGAEQLAFMKRMLDRAVAFRTSHPELEDRWVDVSFYDLVQDPMAVVASIYDHFGWTLEREAVQTMGVWLDRQAAARSKERRHKYNLADYGLTGEAVDAAFARYREFLSTRLADHSANGVT